MPRYGIKIIDRKRPQGVVAVERDTLAQAQDSLGSLWESYDYLTSLGLTTKARFELVELPEA